MTRQSHLQVKNGAVPKGMINADTGHGRRHFFGLVKLVVEKHIQSDLRLPQRREQIAVAGNFHAFAGHFKEGFDLIRLDLIQSLGLSEIHSQ